MLIIHPGEPLAMDGNDLIRGGVLAVLLASAVGAGQPILESKSTFTGHQKTISYEKFEPKADGQYPAVVMLHGAGGMNPLGGGEAFRAVAKVLAGEGYVVLVVHYFDRTDTKFSDLETSKKHFAAWMETIGDAVGHATEMASVDPDRIGLVGFSLGAYLALSEATFDPRIKGVVEFFGGLPRNLADRVKSMPPTLILHGAADPIVPVQQAHDLERLLTEGGITHETHIYPLAGHGFLGADGIDCVKRTLAFLDKHVRGD